MTFDFTLSKTCVYVVRYLGYSPKVKPDYEAILHPCFYHPSVSMSAVTHLNILYISRVYFVVCNEDDALNDLNNNDNNNNDNDDNDNDDDDDDNDNDNNNDDDDDNNNNDNNNNNNNNNYKNM